jgi:hypothetical protein
MRFLSLLVFATLVCLSSPSIFLLLSGLLLVTRDLWTSSLSRVFLVLVLCLLHMVVVLGPTFRLSLPPISPSTPLLHLLQPLLLLRVSSKFSNPSLHSLRPPRKPCLSMSLLLVLAPVIAAVIDNFHLTLISECSYSFLSSLCVSIQLHMF